MEEKKVKVKMLGDFSVDYGGSRLFLGRSISSRPAQFFQMLMLKPNHEVSKERLMVELYGDGDYSDKNSCINTMVHRLRKICSEAGIPEDCVRMENGNCIWNPRIPTEVDVLDFADRMRQSDGAEGEEKLRLLYEAWYLYKGDLLSSNSMESWIIPENFHYKQLYRKCTNDIGRILNETYEYEEMFRLYTGALRIDSYEEWQLGQLDALMGMGKYEEAFHLYQNMTSLYGDTSIHPASDDMLRRFKKLSEYLKGEAENIEAIKHKLEETEEEMKGAYECAYPYFVDMYRLMLRMGDRRDLGIYMMQLKLINRQKMPMQNKAGMKKSQLLSEAIKKSLRCGDIFTQYNTGHFLILLNNIAEDEEKTGKITGGGVFELPENTYPDNRYLRRGRRKQTGYRSSDHAPGKTFHLKLNKNKEK